MEEEVRDAVFGNVGTTVVFRVGPFDAEVLETIFMPKFTKEDLVTLDRRQVYLTLMIDGVGSAPFSAITIPPIEAPPTSYRGQVVTSSRAQFTAPRAEIENAIMKEFAASLASAVPSDARAKRRPMAIPQDKNTQPPNVSQRSSNLPASNGARPFVHRSPTAPPVTSAKSADDLKSILRTVVTKTGAEKEEKQLQNKQSLKETLANVLARSGQPIINNELPKQPERSAATTPPQEPPQKKQPFEVPENALQKVLKGET
jgi:hypothetical protein